MKLQILPASTGITWVKLGIKTFFKQPLALGGLFFMFMGVVSVASIIPLIGGALALAIVPAATLGLMVASLEALRGNFPMPSVLATAFRAGRQRMRAMMVLGAMYALGFLIVMGVTALFDGGQFAELYLLGGKLNREMMDDPQFQTAALIGMALYLPLSLMFWHAPALVHWHAVPPSKAVFFSLVACLRNFWAYLAYGLGWFAVFAFGAVVITTISVVADSPAVAAALMIPMVLTVAAMFFTSLYFTFRDSFIHTEETPVEMNPNTP
jgi:hypothetical protein